MDFLVIALSGTGNTAWAAEALGAAGLSLRGYLPVLVSNNVSVPSLPARIAPPGLVARRKEAALPAIRALAQALGEGGRLVRGVGPYLLPGVFIRRASSRRLAKPWLLWGWDAGRCSRCGLCARECPLGALSFSERGELVFGEDCTYCARCYNRCPTAAILPGGEWADPAIYPRYAGPGG